MNLDAQAWDPINVIWKNIFVVNHQESVFQLLGTVMDHQTVSIENFEFWLHHNPTLI
jgi:hypothetical protein